MKSLRIAFVCGLALAAAALLSPAARAQQDFPNRPVKIIVPFPPGALTDALARMLATRLSETWKQPVIVENKAGAAGNIGTEFVFRSPADGYTLLFTPQQPLTLAKLQTPDLSFDPEQMTPVAMVTRSTVLMLASTKVPVQNLQQLVAYANANPGKLNFGTTGIASNAHLANDLFFMLTKTRGVNVPYQGIAPASTALLAGDIDILFDAMGNALPNVKAGKIRALGVAAEKRNAALPDVPTVAEVVPGFLASLWSALAAPPKTPPAVVGKDLADVAQALKHADFVARFASTPGLEPVGSTPAEMDKTVKEERERWGAVLKAAGTKSE